MSIKKTACFALAALLFFAAAPVFAAPGDFDDSYAAAFPPGHYGGVYLDENGALVTVIVEKYKHLYDHYPPEMNIRFARYSLEELNNTFDQLSGLIDQNRELAWELGYNGMGLSTTLNRVIVYMSDPSSEMIARFQRAFSDSEMIAFIQQEPDREEPLPLDNEDGEDVAEPTPDSPLP